MRSDSTLNPRIKSDKPVANGSQSSQRKHSLLRRAMFFAGAAGGILIGAGVMAYGDEIGADPQGTLVIVMLGVGWILADTLGKLSGGDSQ